MLIVTPPRRADRDGHRFEFYLRENGFDLAHVEHEVGGDSVRVTLLTGGAPTFVWGVEAASPQDVRAEVGPRLLALFNEARPASDTSRTQ